MGRGTMESVGMATALWIHWTDLESARIGYHVVRGMSPARGFKVWTDEVELARILQEMATRPSVDRYRREPAWSHSFWRISTSTNDTAFLDAKQ
jgi:hypothetical protein